MKKSVRFLILTVLLLASAKLDVRAAAPEPAEVPEPAEAALEEEYDIPEAEVVLEEEYDIPEPAEAALEGEFDIPEPETAVTEGSYVRTDESGRAYLVNESGERIDTPGTPVVGGNKYYVTSDGYLQSGWVSLGNWWLYFDPVDFGAYTSGVHKANGNYYLFDADGIRLGTPGTPVINGKKYLVNADGSLRSGWVSLGNWWLYFDPTDFSACTNGVHEADGKYYLFDADGIRLGMPGTPVIDGKKYCFNDDCSLRSGWVSLGNWWLYFDPTDFSACTDGVHEADGSYYLFDADGIRLGTPGTPVIDGKKYCFNEDCSLRSGWVELGEWTLYFDPTDFSAYMDGMYEADGADRLFDPRGVMFKGPQSLLYGGYLYEIDEDNKASMKMTEVQYYAAQVLNQVGWDLRAAYNWSAGLPYSNRSLRAPAGSVHSDYYALYGFKNHTGNCFVMACTFLQMARLLGYEAYFVEGHVALSGGRMSDHGWCELVINGTTYVFDPNFTNETGRNGYLINYGTPGTWRYANYMRAD